MTLSSPVRSSKDVWVAMVALDEATEVVSRFDVVSLRGEALVCVDWCLTDLLKTRHVYLRNWASVPLTSLKLKVNLI